MPSLAELQLLFPTLITQPPFPIDSVVFSVDTKRVAIPTHDLTSRESALLTALNGNHDNHNPWYQFLNANAAAPQMAHPVRLIYFTVDFAQAQASSASWLAALQELFTQTVTSYFIDATHGVIIEEETSTNPSLDDLDGMIQTVDGELYTKTGLYVGHFWPVNQQLVAIVHEEQALAAMSHARPVTTLQHQALRFYTQSHRPTSPILTQLTANLAALDNDYLTIITTLYNHQGNLSSAAKALYLHRNTLQYRLDKFQDLTGFSLRQMDDLVFCYLLVLHQESNH